MIASIWYYPRTVVPNEAICVRPRFSSIIGQSTAVSMETRYSARLKYIIRWELAVANTGMLRKCGRCMAIWFIARLAWNLAAKI